MSADATGHIIYDLISELSDLNHTDKKCWSAAQFLNYWFIVMICV